MRLFKTSTRYSPTLIANVNFSIVYQYGHRSGWSDGFDITQLGFPANYRDGQEVRAIPVTTITGYTGLGNGARKLQHANRSDDRGRSCTAA